MSKRKDAKWPRGGARMGTASTSPQTARHPPSSLRDEKTKQSRLGAAGFRGSGGDLFEKEGRKLMSWQGNP